MSKITHMSTVGNAIEQLQEMYSQGKIKGLMILYTSPDDSFDFFAENLNYLEKLGLLQASISTVNVIAEIGDEE